MEEYKIKCSQCPNMRVFKNKNSYHANRNRKAVCKECNRKLLSQKMKGRKRPPFSAKWKRNLAIGHKQSLVWKRSMNTPEYKEKHRQKMIRLIKENKSKVGYNPKACDAFAFINHKLGWNGLHAKNGKEQAVDVFFLDYYDPLLNVAIEWDEKHHRKPSRHKQDWIKQRVILENLGCEFYRIDDVTKSVRKVDKTSNDKTQEIQNALNKYYESKK